MFRQRHPRSSEGHTEWDCVTHNVAKEVWLPVRFDRWVTPPAVCPDVSAETVMIITSSNTCVSDKRIVARIVAIHFFMCDQSCLVPTAGHLELCCKCTCVLGFEGRTAGIRVTGQCGHGQLHYG